MVGKTGHQCCVRSLRISLALSSLIARRKSRIAYRELWSRLASSRLPRTTSKNSVTARNRSALVSGVMFASKRHAQTVADPRPPVEGKQASLDWSAALTPDVAMIISNIKSRSSFRGNK